ncbi:MAG TPA: malto-oligosyltrehalose trehalohydrolase [Terriglobales bacterium]|nr:malto-oligosyltrehalose trehalohydrolase [Terriglobales bacterium]
MNFGVKEGTFTAVRIQTAMKSATLSLMYGATLRGSTAEFRVWAPHARQVTLRLVGGRDLRMEGSADGTSTVQAPVRAGDRYFYLLDDHRPLPDPVSRLLPEGVHGPTAIVDSSAFAWADQNWHGVELRDYVIYELHVGTFSPEGTFNGVIQRLDYLKSLGISVIELMPVAAFPGRRNWGYDGVSIYAVQASYGGPDGLKRLVDAAHRAGLAVMLDVVYNHLGNEGNYLRQFGPYFTHHHTTPWGDAINYDDRGCEEVRRYVVENALYWIREYHFDGLRLDATQTIRDDSPLHILAEIQENAQRLAAELGRTVCVIAETDENDRRDVLPRAQGGFGMNAVWSDDFHHALHACLTGESAGYYQDFGGKEQIVRALNEGFAFQGEPFNFWRGRKRGTSPAGIPLPRHVICTQNHDQAGNRAQGERLDALVPRGACKLAAALLLLAPETPLLFMGQEYGETAPFQFFTDYGDPVLQKAVREGRRKEFEHFVAFGGEVPDPQDPQTFERSKLQWQKISGQLSVGSGQKKRHQEMLEWYRKLIALRRELVIPGERTCRAELVGGAIVMEVPASEPKLRVIAEFPDSERQLSPEGWHEVLAAEEDGYSVRAFKMMQESR